MQIRTNADSGALRLGEFLEVEVLGIAEDVEVDVFLSQDVVRSLTPIEASSIRREFVMFPEAPGEYLLEVTFSENARRQSRSLRFTVDPSSVDKADARPFEVDLGAFSLLTPSSWEGEVLRFSEGGILRGLSEIVGPGDVVYDVGANLGVYSLTFASLVGEQGKVVSVEANPVCVYFLRANIREAGLKNVQIVPAALLDREGSTDFVINYGNSNLGVANDSVLAESKSGHRIQVPCLRLDDLITKQGLPVPDVVKIDVEGAEQFVVAGMRKLLETHAPRLIIELHHTVFAQATLEVLDVFGYEYFEPESSNRFGGAEEVCERFEGAGVFQLFATPLSS